MRGTKIYLNTLPTACRGLAREGRFSYVTYTRSLCEHDHINVLKDSGFGTIEGRTCRLGRFRLVTEEELVEIFRPRVPDREPEPVEVPDVEDVIGEED